MGWQACHTSYRISPFLSLIECRVARMNLLDGGSAIIWRSKSGIRRVRPAVASHGCLVCASRGRCSKLSGAPRPRVLTIARFYSLPSLDPYFSKRHPQRHLFVTSISGFRRVATAMLERILSVCPLHHRIRVREVVYPSGLRKDEGWP